MVGALHLGHEFGFTTIVPDNDEAGTVTIASEVGDLITSRRPGRIRAATIISGEERGVAGLQVHYP